jgi:hypothetical protein
MLHYTYIACLINTGHIHVNAPAILPHGEKNPRCLQTSSLGESESEAKVPPALPQPASLSSAQRKDTSTCTCAVGTGPCRQGTATCTCAVGTGPCRLGTFPNKKISALMQVSLYLYVSLPFTTPNSSAVSSYLESGPNEK